MSKSVYLEDEILKWSTGQDSIFGPGTDVCYLGLFVENDLAEGGMSEVVGNGYERVDTVGYWGEPVEGEVRNSEEIRFPEATGGSGYGVIVAVGLFDALTGGNLLRSTAISVGNVPVGGIPAFRAGTIRIVEDAQTPVAPGVMMMFGSYPPPDDLNRPDGLPPQTGDLFVDEDSGDVYEFAES